MTNFRITWRHEVNLQAETKEEAKQLWEALSLGQLNREVADGEITSHEFVEQVSFEDEEYNEINL
tara:strand:- start:3654 stop:3848 length:195 start_codon:yes stop_codon:yes gene_type:complete